MKDKVVVTTDHPNTPASCKLTVADLQPVTWTQREDVVYWAPDGKGGIQIARKAPTIDGKTVAQSTTADTAPTAATTTPDLLKAVRWWTTLSGWREKTYNTFIIVAKFIATATNWLTAALSFGKVKQPSSWGAKNTVPSDSAAASNDPGPDFVTGNYDALTIAADAASKLPPRATSTATAAFQPRERSTPN